MLITIDTDNASLSLEGAEPVNIYGDEAWSVLSKLWLRSGWARKHTYDFTWLGRHVIQLPNDLMRLQELIWDLKPTLVIETGVAHGGSLVFYASLLELLGEGRVVGIDIEIRPHNRVAIEAHPLMRRITLIERSSIAAETVEEVRALIRPEDRVLIILDSNHTAAHVSQELELYSPFVTEGSCIVAADGIMQDLSDVPGGKLQWKGDNPTSAAREFLTHHPEFEADPRYTRDGITYFPEGYLRRRAEGAER